MASEFASVRSSSGRRRRSLVRPGVGGPTFGVKVVEGGRAISRASSVERSFLADTYT